MSDREIHRLQIRVNRRKAEVRRLRLHTYVTRIWNALTERLASSEHLRIARVRDRAQHLRGESQVIDVEILGKPYSLHLSEDTSVTARGRCGDLEVKKGDRIVLGLRLIEPFSEGNSEWRAVDITAYLPGEWSRDFEEVGRALLESDRKADADDVTLLNLAKESARRFGVKPVARQKKTEE